MEYSASIFTQLELRFTEILYTDYFSQYLYCIFLCHYYFGTLLHNALVYNCNIIADAIDLQHSYKWYPPPRLAASEMTYVNDMLIIQYCQTFHFNLIQN